VGFALQLFDPPFQFRDLLPLLLELHHSLLQRSLQLLTTWTVGVDLAAVKGHV